MNSKIILFLLLLVSVLSIATTINLLWDHIESKESPVFPIIGLGLSIIAMFIVWNRAMKVGSRKTPTGE